MNSALLSICMKYSNEKLKLALYKGINLNWFYDQSFSDFTFRKRRHKFLQKMLKHTESFGYLSLHY